MSKLKAFIIRLVVFIQDVGVELKKSAWPTRSELLDSTRVVILSVVALAVFVGISDYVLMRILKLIL